MDVASESKLATSLMADGRTSYTSAFLPFHTTMFVALMSMPLMLMPAFSCSDPPLGRSSTSRARDTWMAAVSPTSFRCKMVSLSTVASSYMRQDSRPAPGPHTMLCTGLLRLML